MKRMLAFATVLVFVLTILLNGCTAGTKKAISEGQEKNEQSGSSQVTGSGQTSEKITQDKIKILFWEMYGPNREFDKITEEYNSKSPNVEVVDQYFPGQTQLMQKVQVAAASKSGEKPDIIFYDCINVAATNELFPLVDLNKFFSQEQDFTFNDFYPVFQSFSKIDGKILSLHGWANCEILFYNKKLFKEAGLDPEKPPTTWDEMVEYGKKLTKQGQMGIAFGFLYNEYFEELSWQWQSLTASAGGEIWNDDYTAPAFNTQAGVDALQFLVDCIHKHKVMSLNYPEKGFENGKVAMLVDGTWMTGDYINALKEDLGAAIWPGKVKPAPNVGGEHFMIVQSDDNREKAAWEFVKYMLSPDVNIKVCKLSGMVPTRKSVAESKEFQEFLNANPAVKIGSESMQYAIHRAPTNYYLKCSEAIFNKIEPALYNKVSAEQAIADAEKAVKDILASMGIGN